MKSICGCCVESDFGSSTPLEPTPKKECSIILECGDSILQECGDIIKIETDE